jgi:hypothetical protein
VIFTSCFSRHPARVLLLAIASRPEVVDEVLQAAAA